MRMCAGSLAVDRQRRSVRCETRQRSASCCSVSSVSFVVIGALLGFLGVPPVLDVGGDVVSLAGKRAMLWVAQQREREFVQRHQQAVNVLAGDRRRIGDPGVEFGFVAVGEADGPSQS